MRNCGLQFVVSGLPGAKGLYCKNQTLLFKQAITRKKKEGH